MVAGTGVAGALDADALDAGFTLGFKIVRTGINEAARLIYF